MARKEEQGRNEMGNSRHTSQRTQRAATGWWMRNCLKLLLLLTCVPAWATDVDLIMTDVSTTTTSIPINGTFTATATVKNQGTTGMSSYSTYVGFYLSTDPNITTADTRVGGTSLPSLLAAGASATLTNTNLHIQPTMAPGTYYLGVIADYQDQQPESNESNNALAGTTITVVRDVDLIMTDVSTTTTSIPINGTFTATATVKNQGTTITSSNFYVGYYLSTDPNITTADTYVGGTSIPSLLAAGESSTLTNTNLHIQPGMAPGTYYLGVIADFQNQQPESNESNNTLLGSTTITVVRDADLIMTDVSTTASSVPVNSSFTATATVKNQGTTGMSAYGTYVGFYLSTDPNITTADTRVGGTSIPSLLAAGASATLTNTNLYIQPGMAPGTYYLGVIADYQDQQPESNESNNTLAGTTITVVPNVDLIMTDVSTTTTSLPINGTATVSNTIKNQGTAATTTSSGIGIYLSPDATITTADTLVGSRTISSLAAGASNTATTNITVPLTVAPGTYYIGAVADSASAQPETNESNNALAAGATVAVTNQAPTVTLTSPAANTNATVPASFTLTATAADNDGTITKVDFYQGATLLGTVTSAPYTYTWSNVAAGTYSLTAVATDNFGAQTTSAAVNVTVNTGIAQAYYIYTDQLDTPRQITDASGNVVWQWDNSDPFGNNVPNENPNGAGAFNFNLRFPGQYFDKETGLHYNRLRDYDPAIGRYIQSDLIGLLGGINTYTYVGENPLRWIDLTGLAYADPSSDGGGLVHGHSGETDSPPPPPASTPMSPEAKCEVKCNLVIGSACKGALKIPGPWWVKDASYVACDVVVDLVCKKSCSKNDQCSASGK